MDSYIVRVLRREQSQQDGPRHLDGIVEVVDSGKRHAFHSADELWTILVGMEKSDAFVSPDRIEEDSV